MSSPAEMDAYYSGAPEAPPEDATDEEKAAFEEAMEAYEKENGPPPEPAPVVPPSPPGGGAGKPAARLGDMTAHGGSIIFHTECQVRYIMTCLKALLEKGLSSMECRQDVHDAYNERVDAAHAKMVWTHHGMTNWYKNADGRVTTNSPWRRIF